MFRQLLKYAVVIGLGGAIVAGAIVFYLNSQLPQIITLEDYKPLLVSEVYDRNGKKIGEFFREKRILTPFEEIPKVVVDAFLAAEDSSFYEHGGINYVAIVRALIENIKAGKKRQGASTITQQVARSILLQSNEKTYTRKIKEALLALRMEQNLSKQDILYLYLNQIYLGQGAYGVATASLIYFDKPLAEITLPEAAILAGLPKAPSAYHPLRNPSRAKERQRYVLSRMGEENYVPIEEAKAAAEQPVNVYKRRSFWDKAPFYLETVRQMLIEELGAETVLDKGIKVHTSLDLDKQTVAQDQVKLGLRELARRQGFKGPLNKKDGPMEDPKLIADFLVEERDRLLEKHTLYKVLQPDGTLPEFGPLNLAETEEVKEPGTEPKLRPVLPEYIKKEDLVKAIVTKVDDEWGLTYVRFAETKGLIDIESMEWAREPDPTINSRWAAPIKKPSAVLKKGDVIEIRVKDSKFRSDRIREIIAEKKQKNKKYKLPEDFPEYKRFARVELEQPPDTQASLLALDQNNGDILSMVGGYEFGAKNQLNRAIQSIRQTGSSFKPLVYLSALDKGYSPTSVIFDAPIVYEEEQELEGNEAQEAIIKKWKPTNHSNRFMGDILFRNALIRSLNVPSVKIIEKIGVDWSLDYGRRLGIFSPLNHDFTLALGSSSVTLYEMVKAYSQLGRLGKRITPTIIHKVLDTTGEELLGKISLDSKFQEELENLNAYYEKRRQNYLAWQKSQEQGTEYNPIFTSKTEEEKMQAAEETPEADEATAEIDEELPLPDPSTEPPLFFKNPDQLIKPQSAYVITSLLRATIEEPGGTGIRAKALGRPVAGKTGTTSGYFDAWFMGYTRDIATGVWVGYDNERTLGRGEVGGRSALTIWLEYMKKAHENLPAREFPVPDGIVFSSIDNETGRLAASSSNEIVRQAFAEGTEPQQLEDDTSTHTDEVQDFFKEELAE